MKNNITRRNFLKTSFLALSGLGITSTLSACGEKPQTISINLQKGLYDLSFTDESINKYDSYYDDVLTLVEGIDIITYHPSSSLGYIEFENYNIVDAMERMEKSIQLNHLFEENGMGNFDEKSNDLGKNLSLQQEQQALSLDYEDVAELMDMKSDFAMDSDTNHFIHYIKDYNIFWHVRNNANICISLLSYLLKSYVCQKEGLEKLDLMEITDNGTIIVRDKKTGEIANEYSISSEKDDILRACYESIMNCKKEYFTGTCSDGYIITGDDKYQAYNEAIETAIKNLKKGIACGVKFDGKEMKQAKIVEEISKEVKQK